MYLHQKTHHPVHFDITWRAAHQCDSTDVLMAKEVRPSDSTELSIDGYMCAALGVDGGPGDFSSDPRPQENLIGMCSRREALELGRHREPCDPLAPTRIRFEGGRSPQPPVSPNPVGAPSYIRV